MKALFVLASVVLAAGSVACGDFVTSAQLTQTAEPAAATPVETATAVPAATEAVATATPTAEPATPEPLPTLEDEPTNVPDRMRRWPTASSDSELMSFSGWI